MAFLLLAVLCSAAIALVFKHSETAGMNRYAVTSANYLVACVVGALLVSVQDASGPGEGSLSAGLDEIGRALAGSGSRLSPAASRIWAVAVGLGAGVFFFLSFIYYQISVRNHGVGLAGAFIKLGILVPMSLSLVLWREHPTLVQWCGMALAVGSIALVNWPTRGTLGTAVRPALLLLFVLGGLAEFSNKGYQKYGLQDSKSLFLLITFSVALVLSLAVTLRKKLPVRRRDLVTGLAVGVPNFFCSYFLILALDSVPAADAFPAYGAGTIVILNAAGLIFFKEKLTPKELAAVIATVAALVLINLS